MSEQPRQPMGLRGFHLFFIAVSILLALGVGAWAVRAYLAVGGISNLILGVVCFVGGLVLILYGLRVRRKLRGLGDGDGEEGQQ